MAEGADLTNNDLEPLRVVRVIARLNIGGPAIQAALLTSGLDRGRFNSILVTGTESDREGNLLALADGAQFAEGVEPIVIAELGRSPSPLKDLVAFLRLARLLRQVRPDIVHTHTAKAGTLGRIAARVTGVPVIIHTFHGNVFSGYFGPVMSWLIARWERVLARISTAIIAISARQLDDLLAAGIPRDKIRVIPLGLPLDRFAKHEQPSSSGNDATVTVLDLPADSVAIGFVARLVPVKNPVLMVEAISELRKTVPGAVLVVCGDGPMREEVAEAARKKNVPIRMLGWRADLDQIYPALDAVALSSRNEGLPVAIIEAMAAGVPVAATDVGGVADLLDHGALGELADQDPASLSKAISRALDRTKAQTASARQSALDKYGSARLLNDITALYDELVVAKRNHITRRRGTSTGPG